MQFSFYINEVVDIIDFNLTQEMRVVMEFFKVINGSAG